jgi:septum formation protein
VARISQAKADAAAPHYPGRPILAADTVVWAAGATLGKPAHEGAARQMLLMLSGRTHTVLTGYHVRYIDGSGQLRRISRVCETEVEVRPLTEQEIAAYIDSEEWRGKAGAYAIQGRFSCFVRTVRGNYDSVVGLPLCPLIEDLLQAGLLPQEWPAWRA